MLKRGRHNEGGGKQKKETKDKERKMLAWLGNLIELELYVLETVQGRFEGLSRPHAPFFPGHFHAFWAPVDLRLQIFIIIGGHLPLFWSSWIATRGIS